MSDSKHDAKNRSLPDIEDGSKIEHEKEKKEEDQVQRRRTSKRGVRKRDERQTVKKGNHGDDEGRREG